MKKTILFPAFILLLSFAIYAQTKLTLTIEDPIDGNKLLDVTLKSDANLNINANGDVEATTNWAGVDGFEASLADSGISTVGATPNISFMCTNATNNDCNMVTQDSTLVTVTIDPGATYCNEFAGTDPVPFNTTTNSTDPFIQILTRTINAATSSIYSVECGNNGGSLGKQTINVSLATIPTVSISPASQTVTSGNNSINVSWAASANADECIFTGDWPTGTTIGSYIPTNSATGLPNSSFSFTNITTTKTIAVTCRNSIGASLEARQVYSIAGTTGSKWTQCTNGSNSILQASGNEERTIYARGPGGTMSGLDYEGEFSKLQGPTNINPWPGVLGETISLSLSKGSYISAKFNSGSANLRGLFQYGATGNTQGPPADRKTTVISTCPGNFDSNHLGQAKCMQNGSGNLRWSTDPTANPALYCMLDKNTDYFLNIIHSDNSEDDDYNTSDCADPFCGILAQYSNSTL